MAYKPFPIPAGFARPPSGGVRFDSSREVKFLLFRILQQMRSGAGFFIVVPRMLSGPVRFMLWFPSTMGLAGFCLKMEEVTS